MAARQRCRRRSGPSSGPPQRIGHEAPGVALRGPPLTLTCACGDKAKLRFGETWTCEGCGRRWDTGHIPREEYDEIRHVQLRYRMLPVLLGLLVVALAAFFTLTGSPGSVILLLPIALLGWFVFMRGPHRRRYHEAIAKRCKWTLQEEL
jgi:hypothetical protein